jgi:hypothetical protein
MKKSGVTPSKAAREEFKPAAPFKFADDFDWLVPDDYEVNICVLDWIICVISVADPDPGSGAFLTLGPGSGIGLFRISDPGSRIPNPYF